MRCYIETLTGLRDSLHWTSSRNLQPHSRSTAWRHQSATFFLDEVSLRGQESRDVHSMFLQLVNSAMTHLIGVSIKRESGQRSKLAEQIADLAFRGHGNKW